MKGIKRVHLLNGLSILLGQKLYRFAIRSPSALQIHSTTRCNLDCDYCYSDTTCAEVNLDFLKILKDAKKIGVRHVDFLGGEPLLDPRLKEYIAFCKKSNLSVTIHTNGLLIDDSWLEQASQFGTPFKFSIKFDIQSELDRLLQKNHYQKVLQNIRLCIRKKITVQIHTFIHKGNFDRIDELIDLAKEDGIFLTVERYMNQGRKEIDDKYSIDSAKWNIALSKYHQYCNEMQQGAILLNSLKGNGCACYIDLISIDAKGYVKPCPFTDISQAVGNVADESLKSIWKKYRKLSKSQWMKIPKECRSCKYRLYCHGGCKTAVFNAHKRYDVKDPLCREGQIPMGIFQKPS